MNMGSTININFYILIIIVMVIIIKNSYANGKYNLSFNVTMNHQILDVW